MNNIVAAILVITFCSAKMTWGQAPAPTPDCMTNLLNLSDCLSYVTAGSNLTKPDKPCCPELAGLLESSPQCLCYLLDKNKTASYGFNIDMTRALKLPNVCHVSTPPVSLCSVINGAPTAAPAPSTEGSTTSPASEPAGAVAFGPSPAEAPTPDCMTNLLNLSDCLSYVTAGSNLTKPDKPCCPELAGLVESSPQCLCYLLDKNKTASYGFNIDMDRALKLPNVCHVSTPPVSLCSVINGDPTGAPTPSPKGSIPPGLAKELGPGSSSGNTKGASNIAIPGLASLLALPFASLPILFGI
ncbi:Non-specific lipid transfer protein GPI-anchored 2 [Hibiscus syriacus]|uniref:Non-specific lipid transfer protein GPI-anchored 2 n=1 Tax=Hibiscus syriacus TaxID=106335 RepID=A0A6A3CEL9_HIBSY|nr:non-specific lipid transfer protein GPI-anchored 12-like [Hibiscus syriacus]KAE8727653.1 Non-specific lipid transfer protein GPI-anchored 2 [Hibiscus syriacus]